MTASVGRRVAPTLVFSAVATIGVALSAFVASGRPILASRWSLLWELAVWGVAWIVAVAAAIRLPRHFAAAAILAAGIALRVAALAGPPTTSDDLYRYTWDGKVQAAGLDPYTAPPDSPSLTRLHDPWLWPDPGGCAALHRPAGCTRINRPGRRTIYPPAAETWFAAGYRIGGAGARHKTWQVGGLLTELGVLALLPLALRRWERDPRWSALYALSPVPALEVVNNGHVDGLAILCIVAALAVAAGRPSWRRDVMIGALIGAAALVKLYPGVLVLAFAGGGSARRWVHIVRAGATAAGLGAVAYLPHVTRVGPRVLGYLPGYLREEHYRSGGRFLLAGLAHVPPSIGGLVSVLAVALTAVWDVARRPAAPRAAAVLLGALILATTPVQPWYATSLLAVATVAAWPWWAAVTVAGYPYFFAVILDDRHVVGHGQAAYAAALAVVLVAAAIRPSLARSPRPPSALTSRAFGPVAEAHPMLVGRE